MPFAFHYAARSDVGMVRSENQDSGYAGPRLLAMADGMGGHAGGDIASSTVIGALVDLDGEALGSSEASSALLQRISAANDELAEMAKAEPRLQGMGTTLIAILRSHNKLVLAHIGDSRAFLAREGKLTQITKDHSFVQSLVDEGRITEDEAIGHPQRSLVTRVLTGQHDDEPDVTVREARIGDRYLIASDGLTDYVAGDTIAELVLAGQPPGPTADRLVELALKAGAPDNVTIVIGDVVDLTKVTAPPTQPQIVGAAATRTKPGTRPIPVTPAAKAAALSREAVGRRRRRRRRHPRRGGPHLRAGSLAAPRRRAAGRAHRPRRWRVCRVHLVPAPVLRRRPRRQRRDLPGRDAGHRPDPPLPRRVRVGHPGRRPARLLPHQGRGPGVDRHPPGRRRAGEPAAHRGAAVRRQAPTTCDDAGRRRHPHHAVDHTTTTAPTTTTTAPSSTTTR